jgi:hypothetical protein
VADGLRQFVEAGARHLIFTPATRDHTEEVAVRLLNEVVPRIAAAV